MGVAAVNRGNAEAFYRGDIARKIDAQSRRDGGYIRYEDYAASEKLVEGFARKPFQALNLIYTELAK